MQKTSLPAALLPALHQNHGATVHLTKVDGIQNRPETHQSHEQNTSPIEVLGCDVVFVRPKGPEEGPGSVYQGAEVDG